MAADDEENTPGVTVEDDTPTVRTLLQDSRLVSIIVLSAIGAMGVQAVVPALPTIQSGLSVPDSRIGLVMSAYFLPALVMLPIVGAVCDIYGRRPVVLISYVGFTLSGGGALFAPSFEVLLALRAVQGFSFAALTPLATAYIGDLFRGSTGTTAQGIRLSSNGLVGIVSPVLAGVLAGIGWQYPFLLYAAAAPLVVVLYLYFPEIDTVNASETGSIVSELREWLAGVVDAIYDARLLLLLLGAFVLYFERIVLLTIAPLLAAQSIGLTSFVIGVALAFLGVIRVVVSPLAGRFVATVSRKPSFVISMGVVSVGMGLLAVADSLWVFVVGIMVFGVGFSLFNPTLSDAVATSASTDHRAGVVSAMSAGKIAANTIGPIAAGALLSLSDFFTVFAVVGLIAVVYTAAYVLIPDADTH